MINTYTVKELQPILKKSTKTIREYILNKKLKATYLGNKYVVTEEDVKLFMKQNQLFKY